MRGTHSNKEKNWAQILLRQGMPQSGGHARREALLLPVAALGESTETEVDCRRAASELGGFIDLVPQSGLEGVL